MISLILFLIPVNVLAANCRGIFTRDAYDMIREIITFIKIAVPILLIVLASIDAINILVKGDPDESKKGSKKIIRRFIAAALVFLVPTIVGLILNLGPVKNALNLVDSDDPTCGLTKGGAKKKTDGSNNYYTNE